MQSTTEFLSCHELRLSVTPETSCLLDRINLIFFLLIMYAVYSVCPSFSLRQEKQKNQCSPLLHTFSRRYNQIAILQTPSSLKTNFNTHVRVTANKSCKFKSIWREFVVHAQNKQYTERRKQTHLTWRQELYYSPSCVFLLPDHIDIF